MKERLVDVSFEITGEVVQTIVLTDPDISGEELVTMFNNGEAFTDVDDDGDIYTEEGVIGTVKYSDRELNFTSFQVEGGDYELDSAHQPFNASRLAYSFALGEYISEADELSSDEIVAILTAAGNNRVEGLAIEEGSMDKTGNQLLREIELAEHGFKNLMTIAHAAGKKGQEII